MAFPRLPRPSFVIERLRRRKKDYPHSFEPLRVGTLHALPEKCIQHNNAHDSRKGTCAV